jgi:hypothetical protein
VALAFPDNTLKLVLVVDALDLGAAKTEHRREHALARVALDGRELAFVGARRQSEPRAATCIWKLRFEAVPVEERGAARVRQRAHKELAQVDLPVDARPASCLPARDRERVLGAVGQRADLDQGEERVALQDLAQLIVLPPKS